MNEDLKCFAKNFYPISKADLYAMFMEANLELVVSKGFVAMITMHSWMFLSAYEKLRKSILDNKQILSLVHLGAHAFDSIGGEVVSTTAFVFSNVRKPNYYSDYFKLTDGCSEDEKSSLLKQSLLINKSKSNIFYRVSCEDLKKVPGIPIAYSASKTLRSSFENNPSLSKYSETRIGLITGDNDYYIRFWHEVSFEKIGFDLSREEARISSKKWFPQSKGGEYRKWYGNNYTVVNWENDGYELQTKMHSSGARILAHNFNLDKIFLPGITWTKISTGKFCARLHPKGFLFNDASANAFPIKQEFTNSLLGILCSKIPTEILQLTNPTLNFLPGDISSIPVPKILIEDFVLISIVNEFWKFQIADWNLGEASWGFLQFPLVNHSCKREAVEADYLI